MNSSSNVCEHQPGHASRASPSGRGEAETPGRARILRAFPDGCIRMTVGQGIKPGSCKLPLFPHLPCPDDPQPSRDFVPLGEHEALVQRNGALKEQASIATSGVHLKPTVILMQSSGNARRMRARPGGFRLASPWGRCLACMHVGCVCARAGLLLLAKNHLIWLSDLQFGRISSLFCQKGPLNRLGRVFRPGMGPVDSRRGGSVPGNRTGLEVDNRFRSRDWLYLSGWKVVPIPKKDATRRQPGLFFAKM